MQPLQVYHKGHIFMDIYCSILPPVNTEIDPSNFEVRVGNQAGPSAIPNLSGADRNFFVGKIDEVQLKPICDQSIHQ